MRKWLWHQVVVISRAVSVYATKRMTMLMAEEKGMGREMMLRLKERIG